MDEVERLEREKRELQEEIQRLKRKPQGKISYLLLLLGVILIALAIYYSHNVSAVIGIALTFWGALLRYIRPTQFIRKEVLTSIMVEPLQNTSRLLKELEFKGQPVYISPPTLRGFRSAVLYIPKSDETGMPFMGNLPETQVLLEKPSAVKLTPLGLSLSRLVETELRTNFSTVDLEYLQQNLETAFVDGLELADSFRMEVKDTTIQVEVGGDIFYDLLEEFEAARGENHIVNPLSSAIACILARSTHQPVVIERVELIPEERTTRTEFRFLRVN